MPSELGLAETQQVLVPNDLRGRIRLQTEGKLETGRHPRDTPVIAAPHRLRA